MLGPASLYSLAKLLKPFLGKFCPNRAFREISLLFEEIPAEVDINLM